MHTIIRVGIVLGAMIGGLVAGAVSATAASTYEEVRLCMDNSQYSNPTKGQAWWDRRTPEAQRYMLELPCEEKYIVAVCVFLYDPNLKGCTNKGVARYRADRHCAAQGHEILSESMAACQQQYISSFQPVF